MSGKRELKRAANLARVVDVAFELFAEHGYEDVTVAQICTAAQIAPRTFFRYFPTKDDLLAEPARVLAGRMHDALRAAPAELAPAAALRVAVLEVGVAVVADRARMARLLRVVRRSAAARDHSFLRLADRERDLAEVLVARSGPGAADWRTRLLVARSTAAFRIWLDDLVEVGVDEDGAVPHLREILDLA